MRGLLVTVISGLSAMLCFVGGCAVPTDSGKSTQGSASNENVGQTQAADNVAGCGQTAWSIKVATDANNSGISSTPASYTITQINGLSNPYSTYPASTGISEYHNCNGASACGGGHTNYPRHATEKILVDVKAYLDVMKYENSSTGDSDYHLGIVDPNDTSQTMIGEMPWSGSNSGCGQYGCNYSSYNNTGNGATYGCIGQYFDLSSSIIYNNSEYSLAAFAANRSWFDNMPLAPWIDGSRYISGYAATEDANGNVLTRNVNHPCQCKQPTAGTYNSCAISDGSYNTCSSNYDYMTIHIQGVLFFDPPHGQLDVSSTGTEIHPITKFCIAPYNSDCTPTSTLQNSGYW